MVARRWADQTKSEFSFDAFIACPFPPLRQGCFASCLRRAGAAGAQAQPELPPLTSLLLGFCDQLENKRVRPLTEYSLPIETEVKI